MPVFLEPDKTFPVVLDCDKEKPESERPTFYAKSQSMRGQQHIGNVLDRLRTDSEIELDDLFSEVADTLANVLTGWKNMGDIGYPTDVREFLTFSEARELLRKVMFNQHVTEEEKKSSESQP